MKKIIFLYGTVILLLLTMDLKAQSGFSEGSIYSRKYSISDVPASMPYPKYDYYGNYKGTYQLINRARWYSEYGGNYVYVWNGNYWNYVWRNGYYYWYDWVSYEVFKWY